MEAPIASMEAPIAAMVAPIASMVAPIAAMVAHVSMVVAANQLVFKSIIANIRWAFEEHSVAFALVVDFAKVEA